MLRVHLIGIMIELFAQSIHQYTISYETICQHNQHSLQTPYAELLTQTYKQLT